MLKQRITETELKELIASGQRVVVDFFADWCGPCQMFLPVFHAKGEADDSAMYVSVNIDDESGAATTAGVQGVPTIQVYEGGAKVNEIAGFMPPAQFDEFLAQK